MDVFKVGEKIHVVEKRMFADDVRRHFIGKIIAHSPNALRIQGFAWVYNNSQGKYVRRSGLRERVLILGDRILINILPEDVDLKALIYNSDNMSKQYISDGSGYTLELSEFVNS